jgi:hypothetical protein
MDSEGPAGRGEPRRRRLSQEAGLRRMGSQSNDHLQTSLCTGRWSDRRRARWWASSSGRGRRRGRWEEWRTLKEVCLQYDWEGNLYMGGLRDSSVEAVQ